MKSNIDTQGRDSLPCSQCLTLKKERKENMERSLRKMPYAQAKVRDYSDIGSDTRILQSHKSWIPETHELIIEGSNYNEKIL